MIRWSFVWKGALIGAALYVPLIIFVRLNSQPSPQSSSERHSFGIDPRNTELHSDNIRRMPGDILGSRLYLSIYSANSIVGLKIRDGVVACGVGEDIEVQFDDGPVEVYTCHQEREAEVTLSDGPAILDNAEQFIAGIRKASSVTISPLLMGKGRADFHFTAR
ncbi:MAG: hypothetical protein WDN01_05650 [Rhizomicrobium sp.]